MNSKLHWDDLRLVLAIAESGSLSGAGRHLGTSHATIFRRLGAVETRLGVKLFARAKSGYAPTAAGEALITSAQKIEAEVLDVERQVVGQDLRPSGTVRLTTLDSLFTGLLSPALGEFLREHHKISLEIVLSNQLFSLSRREADVAIRPTLQPDESLVGRKLGKLTFAVYGRQEAVASADTDNPFLNCDWIGPDETMIYPELDKWMRSGGLEQLCRLRFSSVMGMYSAVLDGHGLSVLPCYLGEPDSRLARLSETIPELTTDLWILTHTDLRQTTRVRALMQFLTQSIAAALTSTNTKSSLEELHAP